MARNERACMAIPTHRISRTCAARSAIRPDLHKVARVRRTFARMSWPRTCCCAVLALLALATGAAPASAGGRSHLLGIYKIDTPIDVQGEDGTYTAACHSGDIALDGMWRIDDIDQDNDY